MTIVIAQRKRNGIPGYVWLCELCKVYGWPIHATQKGAEYQYRVHLRRHHPAEAGHPGESPDPPWEPKG